MKKKYILFFIFLIISISFSASNISQNFLTNNQKVSKYSSLINKSLVVQLQQKDNLSLNPQKYRERVALPLEIINQLWNLIGSNWDNYIKSNITYNGVLATEIKDYYWDVAWKENFITTFTYNTNDSLTQVLIKFLEANRGWVDFRRLEYTYDPTTQKELTAMQFDNLYLQGDSSVGPGMINTAKITSTYDNTAKLTEQLMTTIDTSIDPTGKLVNFTNLKLQYSGNQVVRDLIQLWADISGTGSYNWWDIQQTFYTYNAQGKIADYRIQLNYPTQPWFDVEKGLYTYTAFNAIQTFTTQVPQGPNVWKDTLKVSVTYNPKQFETKELLQEWKANAWNDVQQINLTYQNDTLLKKVVYQAWGANTWVNLEQELYSYTNAIYNNNLSHRNDNINDLVYLNSQKSTIVQFNVNKLSTITCSVYDSRGNLILNLIDNKKAAPGRHRVVWDKTNRKGDPVATGMYIFKLKIGGVVITKPMTLID